MSDWYTRTLTGQATLWVPAAGRDGWGNVTSWTKSTIAVRWEEATRRFIDRMGRETVSSAVVYITDATATEGSYLYHGASSQTVPTAQAGAYIVRKIESTPQLCGGSDAVTERVAYL